MTICLSPRLGTAQGFIMTKMWYYRSVTDAGRRGVMWCFRVAFCILLCSILLRVEIIEPAAAQVFLRRRIRGARTDWLPTAGKR
jgi:hypothetical protein